MTAEPNRRILIADDVSSLHEDYRKVLQPGRPDLGAVPGLSSFLGRPVEVATGLAYELDFVWQGEEAIQAVQRSLEEERRYAVIFLDVRMPPGIDGVTTAQRIMNLDTKVLVVLCTAYADYSFSEIARRFEGSDRLLLLKKPFDPAEIHQMAHALTTRWDLQERHEALLRDLEARVEERTQALARARDDLARALELAKAGERSKGNFLACVSHELNTPLNGISMASELISLSGSDEASRYAGMISEASERLQRLFGRILVFTELDDAKLPEWEWVDWEGLLGSVVAGQRPSAQKKGLARLVENAVPSALQLARDPSRLSHALEIVVENAVKFTDAGRVVLRCRLEGVERLIVEVDDTGPGIAPAQAAALYQLFSPGDANLNRRHEGLGLGLCLAKKLLTNLGGALEHQNKESGGSVFVLRVPVRPAR